MELDELGEILEKKLKAHEPTRGHNRAFLNLCYTASETGLLPFKIRDDCSETILALVALAKTFEKSGVPEELRV